MTDNPFDPGVWRAVDGFANLTDITYHRHVTDPTVRVAFNRPEVRNAFRPHTVDELYRALDHARMSPDIGVVLLTGNGPSPKDGGWAFCSGGDQRIRGRSGYQYASGETADTIDTARAGRLHILEVQRLIRFMPKVVICLVNGWAAGGGTACMWCATSPWPAASTPGSNRPMPTWAASTAVTAARIWRARWARSSPGKSSFWAAPTPPTRCMRWARSTRWSTTPSWSRSACNGQRRSTRNLLRRNGC
ncbi:1,4-Dihydroxy-2-naphthoyl-CoA synthase [Mycobacterium xenopi 3993]|nr:1,4-Dihydroxy-2-naphthoyl-CoA synthase [Mycobacterium xenopi 3993]